MGNNFRQAYAKQKSAEERWLKTNPYISNESGIYILTRIDENGVPYAYVGQAKNILKRLGQHLLGYQHIDLSLKKHGLYNLSSKPYGWKVIWYLFKEEELNEKERYYINLAIQKGYQMRNKTLGGQDEGKVGLNENKPSKGYYDGKTQGYEDARKYVKTMFDKYLDYQQKTKNKITERKEEEFTLWLKEKKDDD